MGSDCISGKGLSGWAHIRAWWGIDDLSDDEQLEWLERETSAHSENELREDDIANEESWA